MGTDTILLGIIFDWTFINPLIERDDGETINEVDEASIQLQEQTVAQGQTASEVYY